ncbi:hypothetical protein J4H86_19810 [Spiractinospora alimapuensis]|uniref:hypothetical protein n=1 Tax=Spiractinospora alimapuensis TaxID=2820884 RepID=UPI001F3BEDF6|nr:hypothetical protein [Spiractinospora alimapuensis]QVQ51068.1 hypothetical protein J4H86_19810 [Spiractinospora alimapuensis]
MNMPPKDRLLNELLKHGDVYMGWQQLPNGTHIRTYHLHNSPLAEWHGDHWRVADAVYPLGSEDQVALRLATHNHPTT